MRCHIHYLTGRADDRLSFDLQREIADAPGLPGPPGQPRRRALHQALLPARQDRRRPHAHLRRRPRGQPPAQAQACRPVADACGRASSKVSASTASGWPSLRPTPSPRTGGDPAAVPCGAGERPRHPSRDAAPDHPEHPPGRPSCAPIPRPIGLFMEMMTSQHDPETTLAASQRGRRVRPLRSRFRSCRRPDAARHVSTPTRSTSTPSAPSASSRASRAGTLKEDHPLSAEVVHKILSRPVLYLAVLLHDIAKGRGGDHSVLGADVAMQLGPRLGLSAAETETVSWLVRYHLAMSGTAFQRDLMDPKTIDTFAALVQSPERLRLLLVLTVCDIRAVGPNVWNGWKAALLRQLYNATEQVLSGGTLVGGRAGAHQADPGRGAPSAWRAGPRPSEEEHFARGYAPYWLSVRSRHPGAPGRAGAARRARAPAARHRASHRRRALGHRGHDLHPRHARPVRPPGRRHGDQRRQHRRRQDLHLGQRHGARHLLDPGPRGQAVRRPAAPGSPRRPRRDRAAQPPRHPARARQPARRRGPSATASSPSSRAC